MAKTRASKMENHYARQAQLGRSVRFELTLDMRHTTPEERVAYGLSGVRIDIKGGTLTAAQAAAVMKIINGD